MKPEEISDWISSAEENGSILMIVNCAMDDRLHRKLKRSGLRCECLYEGDKVLELDDVYSNKGYLKEFTDGEG